VKTVKKIQHLMISFSKEVLENVKIKHAKNKYYTYRNCKTGIEKSTQKQTTPHDLMISFLSF